ncbi:MAG: hypothetical protein JSV74_01275 [Dehalococcoidia bacterium]|nr:MAG: hypothetical protein JSV74_01275 [Dehalococcoidia bacterium]
MALEVGSLREERAYTVEDYLNNINYRDDPMYVPSEFALHFVNFIKLVNGEDGEENLTPVLHYKMLDQLPGKKTNIANMCFRGSAKTTVTAEYLFLYIAVFGGIPGFGDINLALYVSDSIDNGVKNMRKNLQYRYENSIFLQRYIPEIKFTDTRWEFTNLDGKPFIVKGYGAKTGVRGTKELGQRPELAVLDDLISDDDARSPTVIASIEDTVYKAIDYALHPTKRKIIWSGTPFDAGDPLYKAIESGAWHVNVFPVCEDFPCEPQDFVGAWEDRFPYEFVKDMYEKALKSGKVDTFNQEMMLRIMSDDERLIRDEDINWYSRKQLLQNRGAYNFYITTDFATSERQGADFSVISVWAYNSNGDWFWVDGHIERCDMGVNIDKLFEFCQFYKPLEVGIEVSGQQGGFIPMIEREMMNRNSWFNLASENNNGKKGIRPVTQKLVRFQTMVPQFKAGKFYFPEERKNSKELREAITELKLVTPKKIKSKHDDFLDTVSMLACLNVFKPSDTGGNVEYNPDNDMWEIDEIEDNEECGLDSYI